MRRVITKSRVAGVAALLLLLPLYAPPAGAGAPTQCRPSVGGLDLRTATIPQLEGALRAGKITSVELVKAYLARIDAYDGRLDSIRTLSPDALKIAAQRD